MLLIGLITLILTVDPELKPKQVSAPKPDSAAGQTTKSRASSAARPLVPTSATEIYAKIDRLKDHQKRIGDDIVRVERLIVTAKKLKREHEKVLRGERPWPKSDDPLLSVPAIFDVQYDPQVSINALILRIFKLGKDVQRHRWEQERLEEELLVLEAQIKKYHEGPYLIFGTIPLGGTIDKLEIARKIEVEPTTFNATLGRVGRKDGSILNDTEQAFLRAVSPHLIDVYEIDDFDRPELIREFGKLRVLVERSSGVIFAVTASWTASGTEAETYAPIMAKRSRELLTVLKSNYPDLKADRNRVHDVKDRFFSISVANERTNTDGTRIEFSPESPEKTENKFPVETRTVMLTYTLTTIENRVIDTIQRIESRRAVGGIEELKKKGNGL